MLESEVREVTSSRTKCGGVSSHSLASWEEGQEVKEEEGQEKEEAEIERIGSKEKRKERGGRMKGRRQESRKGGRGEGRRRERRGRESKERRDFNFFIPQHSTNEVTAHIYQFISQMLQ